MVNKDSNIKKETNSKSSVNRPRSSSSSRSNYNVKNKTNNSQNIKKKKKKKKKKKISFTGIISIVLLFIIVDAIFIKIVIDSSNKKKENNNEEIEIKEKEKVDTNDSHDENTNNTNENENISVEGQKLKELDNINERISFFKNANVDRYIAYKSENPNLDLEKVIVYVNIGLDRPFYDEVEESPKKDTYMILTNKYYGLKKDYEPKNLTSVSSNYSSRNLKMVKEAANAFDKMAKAAKESGYNIRAISTYRSYYYQKDLYNNYVAKDGQKNADTYSARPGFSEHQTGYAVDIDNTKVDYTSFGSTKEFEWMKNNSYKYGYILRYTKENEWITGYKDEPWHYRYVGEEIAKYIHENPMTYEEYFVRFLDY